MNIMPHAVIWMQPAALAGFSQPNYACLPDFKELCLKAGVERMKQFGWGLFCEKSTPGFMIFR